MSVCRSNGFTTFSSTGTVSPSSTRRLVWSTTRATNSRYASASIHQVSAHRSVTSHAAHASPRRRRVIDRLRHQPQPQPLVAARRRSPRSERMSCCPAPAALGAWAHDSETSETKPAASAYAPGGSQQLRQHPSAVVNRRLSEGFRMSVSVTELSMGTRRGDPLRPRLGATRWMVAARASIPCSLLTVEGQPQRPPHQHRRQTCSLAARLPALPKARPTGIRT